MTTWSVHHPGIGVLDYATEADARVAAGTAGTLLRDGRHVHHVHDHDPTACGDAAPATEEGHRP